MERRPIPTQSRFTRRCFPTLHRAVTGAKTRPQTDVMCLTRFHTRRDMTGATTSRQSAAFYTPTFPNHAPRSDGSDDFSPECCNLPDYLSKLRAALLRERRPSPRVLQFTRRIFQNLRRAVTAESQSTQKFQRYDPVAPQKLPIITFFRVPKLQRYDPIPPQKLPIITLDAFF